jgi:hypothetical protein
MNEIGKTNPATRAAVRCDLPIVPIVILVCPSYRLCGFQIDHLSGSVSVDMPQNALSHVSLLAHNVSPLHACLEEFSEAGKQRRRLSSIK